MTSMPGSYTGNVDSGKVALEQEKIVDPFSKSIIGRPQQMATGGFTEINA